MKLYYKFKGIPFAYTEVKAVNGPAGDKIVSRFRSDFVRYGADEKVLSFEDIKKLKFVELQEIEVEYIGLEITDGCSGEKDYISVPKGQVLETLQNKYREFPGINKANIFSMGGQKALCVPITPSLIKFIKDLLGVTETPKELKSGVNTFPIIAFKEVKAKKENNVMLLK
jgi:hypothetical protein